MTLREGEDFYLERGLYVFTAAFLSRRGYCCANRCRHCPYWPRHGGGMELASKNQDGGPHLRPPLPIPGEEQDLR